MSRIFYGILYWPACGPILCLHQYTHSASNCPLYQILHRGSTGQGSRYTDHRYHILHLLLLLPLLLLLLSILLPLLLMLILLLYILLLPLLPMLLMSFLMLLLLLFSLLSFTLSTSFYSSPPSTPYVPLSPPAFRTPPMFRRPIQSQGLLYKHLRQSFIHSFAHSVTLCKNIRTTPLSPNSQRWCFQSYNGVCYNILRHSKSQRISKLYCWLKSYA